MANRKQKSWIPHQCKIVYCAQSCNLGNLLIKPTYLYNIYSLWFSAYTWDMSVHECILLFNQYQRFSSPYLHLVALSCKNQPHLHIKNTNFCIYINSLRNQWTCFIEVLVVSNTNSCMKYMQMFLQIYHHGAHAIWFIKKKSTVR